jgi:3-oxoacyl-(acyl-carrier-protein) synthase
MNNPVYILSAAQISAQNPLSDDWFENPVVRNAEYVRAIEPDYKAYFTALEARRYGKLLKRALLVSRKAMELCTNALPTSPDAIVTGTGLGCVENTELFLNDLVFGGEEMLKPTHFINSTHNTISSLVAIDAKCHGYNSTYVQKGVSFETALQDACLQLQSGEIATALVGGHDEMTPDCFKMLKKTGYLDFSDTRQGFAGETAVAMTLSNKRPENALCQIESVETFYGDPARAIASLHTLHDIDAIMLGTNGQPENDRRYYEVCETAFPNIPTLHYKHIFGESYTAPALGIYAASICLRNGQIPAHLFVAAEMQRQSSLRKIMFYNNFENKNHSLILLSRC